MTEFERLLEELSASDEPVADALLSAQTLLADIIGEAEIQSWQLMIRQLLVEFPLGAGILKPFILATPALIKRIDIKELQDWTDLILTLGHRSPLMASAFIDSSISVIPDLNDQQRSYWANMGLRLASGGWKSLSLACNFFKLSDALLHHATTAVNNQLVDILCIVEKHSIELATSCLRRAPQIFSELDKACHQPFLDLARVVYSKSRADIWLYFEKGPELVQALDFINFADLLIQIVKVTNRPPFALLSEIVSSIQLVEDKQREPLYRLAAKVADRDVLSAGAFLTSVPRLLARIDADQTDHWIDQGLGVNDGSVLDVLQLRAFFNLESTFADEALASLSSRVVFERTANLFRLYAQALSGEDIRVQPVDHLDNIVPGLEAIGDGKIISVPQHIDAFMDQEENLLAYKVCIAHQSGRLQFGSFEFEFGLDGKYLISSLSKREVDRRDAFVPMQRFFNLFPQRELALGLFTLVDDHRIDHHIKIEYPGLRQGFKSIKALAAQRRPGYQRLALREVFIENLLLATLGSMHMVRWPQANHKLLLTAMGVLGIAARPGSSVQDCAEISSWMYDLAMAIPYLPSEAMSEWRALPAGAIPCFTGLPELPVFPNDLLQGKALFSAPRLTMDFRGFFKPELVQAMKQVVDQMDVDTSVPEKLKELLEHSVEVDADSLSAEQIIAGLKVDQIPEEARWVGIDEEDPCNDEELIKWFNYDEWDFRVNDYRRGWCQVGERNATQSETAYYKNTLAENHALVVDIRRQFELMRPESQHRTKNLDDGPELDLEQATQFLVDKKAGVGPRARFYSRRNKVERSVAVSFLLDMSGSTSEAVEVPDTATMASVSDPDGLIPLRIIDFERKAIVLIMEALESIGDAYGVYGFSGYGRKKVSFLVIKELEQPLDDTVRKRVDGIEPLRSTRMGAAIRHAKAKLENYPAKVKLLILISDGRPEDQGYGRDRDDVDYGVHDTKQSLVECKEDGIVPFLITVDRKGEDYLQALCKDIGYEVVNNIQSLPKRIPAIYQYLTGAH